MNQRVLLYFTLFFIIYMIWAQWQLDYGPKPEPVVATQANLESDKKLSLEDIPQAEILRILNSLFRLL